SSADSALQSVVTQIDGVAVKTITKADNTANFLKGDNILLTPESGGIKVALAKDLTGLNSVTTGNTVMNTSGVSFTGSTVNLSGTGLNNGGNQITNVKAGTEDMDAVNVGQLNLANTTIDKGLNFGGDSGTDVNRKLGQKLIVKGGDTINADSATKNISVTANGDDTLTVRLAKDINLGETGSVTTGNTQVNNAGITLYRGDNGQVVLTNNGLNNGNNKITNVAAGLLSATSKDAVNGSQLFKTNEDVAKGIKFDLNGTTKTYALGEAIQVATDANITTTAFGNGAKFGLADTIKIGGTSANAVSIDGTAGIVKGLTNTTFDASTTYTGGQAATQEQLSGLQSGISDTFDKGISFGGDNAPTTIKRKLGEKIIVKGGVSDPTKLTDSNIGVIADGTDTLTVKLAKDLTGLNSASFGNDVMISSNGLRAGTTVINTGGVSFSGSTVSLSSSGLNNGGNVITNVARGEATTDAVNVGQLNEVKQSAADANKGWNVSAQGANTSTVKPSDKVDLNNTDNNITVSKTAESNNVSFNLSKDIAVDSVKTGDATMNSSGLTIAGGPKFTKTSIDAGGNKITNVANGVVAFESKDAVNGGQLQEVITGIQSDAAVLALEMGAGLNFNADSGSVINKKAGSNPLSFKGGNNITTTSEGSSIKFDLNGNINVESVTTGNTTVNNSGVTIKNGPSMTAAGIYAGNAETAPSMTAAGINAAGTKVTNVADGMAPRDAVNFGQLDAVSRGLGNSINELGYRVDEVEDDANAGISAAMAMSSLPQAYIIGKSMIGGGIATYNGESAVAIGFSKLSDDGRWVMKLNGTADTQGNVGAAIGAGFHFD
ncbi:YadA family autotransporter adhesin, partial [Psychrobacter sp. DAB_AL32B]|uniref:YadA family autotransporter adhesin n=1 Tax=Psychrobacter sp. DAB_AL32B TaxID=1028414 RepID=UPI000B9D0D98